MSARRITDAEIAGLRRDAEFGRAVSWGRAGALLAALDELVALRAQVGTARRGAIAECVREAERVRAEWRAESGKRFDVNNDDGAFECGLRAAGAAQVLYALRSLAAIDPAQGERGRG